MLIAKTVRVLKLTLFAILLALFSCTNCASSLIKGPVTGNVDGYFTADVVSAGKDVVRFRVQLTKKSIHVESAGELLTQFNEPGNWKIGMNELAGEVVQVFPELSNTMSETLDILVVGHVASLVPDSIRRIEIAFKSPLTAFRGKAAHEELECFYEYLKDQPKK